MKKTKTDGEVSPQREIAIDLLRQFPNTPSLTLAKMAYSNNLSVYPTLDAARSMFRTLRGTQGDKNRKRNTSTEFYQTPSTNTNPFPNIPEGKKHFTDWGALEIPGPARALVLSDLHIPYHDRSAIIAALKWGKQNAVDAIVLNGDTADFFSVSFWEKDPRKRKFAEELKTVQDFMATLRKEFPKARIIFKEGNHEERLTRYMFVKAPELLGIPEFEIPSLLELGNADFVTDKKPIRLGKLNVIHGHEYRFAISNPVNPARGLFLRCKAYAICGHFHQSSYHSEKNVEQDKIATWSTGCLCDMHPDYAPYNNWSHGFAFVEVFSDGRFEVQNKIVSSGRVF